MTEGEKILRYSQLVFKRQGLERQGLRLPVEESVELDKLKGDLNMSHEEILQRAQQRLIRED